MQKISITIYFIILTISAFAQTDSTKNANPDWAIKPNQRSSLVSQNTQKTAPAEWKQKMKYGGNLGLSYWNGAYIEVSPMAGYKLTEKGNTVLGLGVNIIYTSNTNYSAFDYGFRVFLEQNITSFLALHGEIETMSAQAIRFVDFPVNGTNADVRKWETYPQVGLMFYPNKLRGGYSGTSYYIGILYNLSSPNAGYVGTGYYIGNGLTLRFGYF